MNVLLTLVIRRDGRADALTELGQTVLRIKGYLELARTLVERNPKALYTISFVDGVAVADIERALEVLGEHPLIGRNAEAGRRELVLLRGRAGYVATHR